MLDDRAFLDRPATRLTQRWTEPNDECVWPDCWRTVIAMLLGAERPDEVPHFGDFVRSGPVPDGMGRDAMKAWLHDLGIEMVEVPLPQWSASAIVSRLGDWLKSCPAMLEGHTAGGHQHCVAVINGEIVDTVPWTDGNPIVEPGSDGLFWLTILVPQRADRKMINDE